MSFPLLKRCAEKKSEQTLQAPEPEASDLPMMVPLSVAEIRRLFSSHEQTIALFCLPSDMVVLATCSSGSRAIVPL